MNPNEIQDLVELLIEIGGSLAQAGFELAVRRTAFLGAINLCVSIILLVVGIISLKATIRFKKQYDEDRYSDGEMYSFLTGVVSGCCFIFGFETGYQALDNLINPQWNAVQMLLELIQ